MTDVCSNSVNIYGLPTEAVYPSTDVCGASPDFMGKVSMGTTIIAIKHRDGVLLAADSRTSSGQFVVNRVARKITRILPNVFMLRSGSAADSQNLSTILRYHGESLKLQLKRSGRRPSGKGVEKMDLDSARGVESMDLDVDTFQNVKNTHSYTYQTPDYPILKSLATVTRNLVHEYRNHLHCGIILGGFDSDGPGIYNVTLGGTLIPIKDFVASGSGSGYITAFLQDNYKEGMEKNECLELLRKSIHYAIHNDNASGGIMRAIDVQANKVDEFYIHGF
ncbi:proteasome subunit y, putative [Theileria equi strain WA]|uniref:Proteasome subunit y, putative n=1 Tax=Theileria equi strain WA TaxID=1537102 RepID=L0AVE1_THEEQ|nr:proteasome subunit y, putative [Theileria equi strain WA]AFZ79510.1 proteasome subunit y, putative [Theileria equi strain WA]|eukprot:XP_004829176.1 proteasome subunit y, putative [Theileria equi strain WA]